METGSKSEHFLQVFPANVSAFFDTLFNFSFAYILDNIKLAEKKSKKFKKSIEIVYLQVYNIYK